MKPLQNGTETYRVFGADYSNGFKYPRYYQEFYESLTTALQSVKTRLDSRTPLGSIEVTKRDADGGDIAEVRMQFGTTQITHPTFVRNYGNKAFLTELEAKWNALVGM